MWWPRAYAQLAAEGWLDAQQGRGYFVIRQPAGNGMAALADQGNLVPDPLFRLLQAAPNVCKLGGGWLPLAWRDTDALARAVRCTAASLGGGWSSHALWSCAPDGLDTERPLS